MTAFLWTMAGGFVLGIVLLIIFTTRKNNNPVAMLLSIALAAVCAISFVVDISVEPIKTIDGIPKSLQEAPVEDGIDTDTSYDEIYKEFKRNKLNAQDIYNGKKYTITAKINGMATGGLLNLTGGATLTMETQVDNTIVLFLAEFEEPQEESLKQISVGDTISFVGTCYDGSFSDCELEK